MPQEKIIQNQKKNKKKNKEEEVGRVKLFSSSVLYRLTLYLVYIFIYYRLNIYEINK